MRNEEADQQMAQDPREADVFEDDIVVLYFGAGRGPLIRRALTASRRAKVNVKVVALDKNPNAIVTLRNMIVDE